MALTRNEIQKKSDAKRGVQPKTYKLPVETVALIKRLAEARGMTQVELIRQAVEMFEKA
ncbi:MAG: CopG family transcriptional regulator [Neisseria sp.]|nr:CopG family transcriptional regulator [Neisseria sp.]